MGARRSVGWAAVVVFSLTAALMLAGGWIHDGWAIPDIQCINAPRPEQGGPFYENTRITGSRPLFPLGIDCTYDVPGDGYGLQTVHNYNLVPSTILVISLLGIAGGVILINRTRPEAR